MLKSCLIGSFLCFKCQATKIALCYNLFMSLKELMKTYLAGWRAVEEIQREERRSAPLELRWQKLNAAYGLAKGLGILQPDSTEEEVIKRWVILKDQTSGQVSEATVYGVEREK
jgi:hypothetical protein